MSTTPHTWRGWLWRRVGRALLLAVLIPGWVICGSGALSTLGCNSLIAAQVVWGRPNPAAPSFWQSSVDIDARDGALHFSAGLQSGSPTGWYPLRYWVEPAGRGVLAGPRGAFESVGGSSPATRAGFAVGVWLPVLLFVVLPALLALVYLVQRRGRYSVDRTPAQMTIGGALAAAATGLLTGACVLSGLFAIACLAHYAGLSAGASVSLSSNALGWPDVPAGSPQATAPNDIYAQANTSGPGARFRLFVSQHVTGGMNQPLVPADFWSARFIDLPTWNYVHGRTWVLRDDCDFRVGGWLPCVLFLLFVVPTFLLWRRRAARRPPLLDNLCLTCGYSLTGNTSGRCPECGTAVPVRADTCASTAAVGPSASVPHP